jgi:hypothetical protein
MYSHFRDPAMPHNFVTWSLDKQEILFLILLPFAAQLVFFALASRLLTHPLYRPPHAPRLNPSFRFSSVTVSLLWSVLLKY